MNKLLVQLRQIGKKVSPLKKEIDERNKKIEAAIEKLSFTSGIPKEIIRIQFNAITKQYEK